MTKRQQWVLLTEELTRSIFENTALPRHLEQLDNFILWMGTVQPKYGEQVNALTAATISAVGAVGRDSLSFVVSHAIDLGFVEGKIQRVMSGMVRFSPLVLSFKGWSRFEELQRGAATTTRQAFMAMKFGDPETDALFHGPFKAAVQAAGFDLRRLDEEPRAGLIDDRLRVEIRQSRFLIADLTHANPGAYWEAGFAEGLDKPVIFTCRKDVFDDPEKRPHFDTNHHLTVVWDPADLDEAVEMLKATIRATLPAEAKLSDGPPAGQ